MKLPKNPIYMDNKYLTYNQINILPLVFKKKVVEITKTYSFLEDICKAQKYNSFPLDIPLNTYSPERIEDVCSMTRDILGVKDSIILDLANLLETHGLRLISMDLPGEITSFSYYNKSLKSLTFFINSKDSIERNTFTLAHELAHVIFHQGSVKYNLHDPQTSIKIKEKTASYFAACFLMPEKTVKSFLNQLGINKNNWTYELLLRIKIKFGVSSETFLYRLMELDLIRACPKK